MQKARSEDTLRSARALFDQAGIRYTVHTRVGPVAETLARFAREEG